jgi:molybdenum cofactor cytidylyltransferase
MQFGPVPVDQAQGAILAHSVELPKGRMRKGQVLDAAAVVALAAAGLAEVVVARLSPTDLPEDEAASRLAAALVSDPEGQGLALSTATTGRVNLVARGPGVLEVDAAAILALNRMCPEITLATLPHLARVSPGMLCGTVKIISYAVPAALLEAACRVLQAPVRVRPVVLADASLILTEVPGQDPKLSRKGRRAIETRLQALGMALAGCETVAHDETALAAALARAPAAMVLILTGSATSDLHDTAPQALRRAGGRVDAVRDAGRSGQPPVPRQSWNNPGDRPARMRPQPRAERGRLGDGAADLRPARDRRRHRRNGGRGASEGNPDARPSARGEARMTLAT